MSATKPKLTTVEPAEVEEASQPLTAAEMLPLLIQDLVGNADPAIFAGEVIDSFVLTEQPESGQILALLETDTPTLITLIKAAVSQGVQETLAAIDKSGPQFIERVKGSLREQLSQLASDSSH